MPRKAKEKVVENEEKIEKKTTKKATKPVVKATAKPKAEAKTKTTSKVAAKPKKETTKKAESKTKSKAKTEEKVSPVKKTAVKKATKATAKVEDKKETVKKAESKTKSKSKTEEKVSSVKKTAAKKASAKSTEKATTTKKKTSSKSAKAAEPVKEKKTAKTAEKKETKKTTTRKRTTSKKAEEIPNIQILEYYDLPYKYGNTIVKLLAQTPKTLFVYWEISDEDINNFKQKYGDDFFNITKPILIVHNLTLNKTNEIEINDFANCWYLNTEDSDCKYDIELARKFIKSVSKPVKAKTNDYLYVAKSNELESPNDHIMFEKLTESVTFKNYKTNQTIEENFESFKFLRDIYKFYQDMYKDELLKNPSSKF